MRFTTFKSLLASSLALTFVATGCVGTAGTSDDSYPDNDPPLANVDELLANAPKADEIPRAYAKFDDIADAKHTALRDVMSPVQSQGRRGVCSIFSTVGLMEHLYIKAGHSNPDFSEQYLQWSAKFEVNSFPESSGSNAFYNLQAISRFGIVAENVWPYEANQWGTAEDAECDGEDDQPTRCYTNGHPSDEIKNADKFFLPGGRFLNPRDIKGHIVSKGTGAIVGLTFFYQSWNHRKSELPTNSDYWDNGYVLAPNARDRELSLAKRAGHSIVIMGWDDELEVPMVDEAGEQILDASGNPEMEKGFYIFKNSWGTSGFGVDHELGAGYGYISMKYVHEFGRVRTAGLPDAPVFTEICGDNIDNDGNSLTDCDDPVCADNAECQSNPDFLVFEGEGDLSIPDNSPVGVSSVINITDASIIKELVVDVDISHSFRSDLQVSLHRGGDTVVLFDRTGGNANDLVDSFSVTEFNGSDLRGEWKLVVTDSAAADKGTLNGWSLKAAVE